jgi:hypothetical protein
MKRATEVINFVQKSYGVGLRSNSNSIMARFNYLFGR